MTRIFYAFHAARTTQHCGLKKAPRRVPRDGFVTATVETTSRSRSFFLPPSIQVVAVDPILNKFLIPIKNPIGNKCCLRFCHISSKPQENDLALALASKAEFYLMRGQRGVAKSTSIDLAAQAIDIGNFDSSATESKSRLTTNLNSLVFL